MEQLTLHVTGMDCAGCERRIEKVLARLDGVRRSSADHQKAEVQVVFDPTRIAAPAVRAAIERAGYTVGSPAGT